MQETNSDGKAETTLQTIQEEPSHKITENTEDEMHSEQEELSVQVPDLMPTIVSPQGRSRGGGRGRTPG